ncbi:MAG: NAD(P)-dependent oxidoreductase [Gammaproteobacteria bacterium]|nr:NAD(P)-dependent oxidoreductase [Gammaproteobacteria bacterium]
MSAPARKTVFVTGTTGSMGGATLRELLGRRERFDIVTLARPSARNRKILAPYLDMPGVRIEWGDLTCYDDVARCMRGADVVLHAAALISPEADRNPEQAWKINVGSVENIIRAIRAQPDPDAIRLVSVGTVAATGDRLPPIHWGRTGDPLQPSVFDMYGCSKIAAERLVAESGLKYWVSLRQTFIAIADLTSLMDPIMFHQPLDTCIEFCTMDDSGRLLANACEDSVPEEFWRRFYNIGGGERCRLNYIELQQRSFDALGIGKLERLSERNWFATRNFHCQWYEDSDALEGYLHFRSQGIDEYLQQVKAALPAWQRIGARLVPAWLVKKFVLQPLARDHPDSTMYWLDHDRTLRISAFFRSREDWARIPAWGVAMPADPRTLPRERLDHGYDESKPAAELDLVDMQHAARFRGGSCESTSMVAGALFAPLRWRCSFGHAFEATPNLVLRGGHWCPECAPPGWNYDEQARRSPFFAQVWHSNHDSTEDNVYPRDCYKDIAAAS